MNNKVQYECLSLFDYPDEDYRNRIKRLIGIFDFVIKIQEEKIKIMEGKKTGIHEEIDISVIKKEMKNRGPTN